MSKRGVKQSRPPQDTQVIFLGQGRCYHTFDWYRSAQLLLAPKIVPFATDLIVSEGHPSLLRPEDLRIDLVNIDALLFRQQSAGGNIWRNIVKAAVIPLQALKLRGIARQYSRAGRVIFHAHSMYYLVLCWLAKVDYVGTPQGSEVLVRPGQSRLYRLLAKRALLAAQHVTVDSANMQRRIREMCGKDAIVIQNGVDIPAIVAAVRHTEQRSIILSNRGIYPLYRIDQIIAGRDRARPDLALTFSYPSWENNYKTDCFRGLRSGDRDLGRLPTRAKMYELMGGTLLVLSVPEVDSSPRSVYEAIFCGCCVATVYNTWIEDITDCMKARIHLVDLADPDWFAKAVERAFIITRSPYVPSELAKDRFDQQRSLRRLAALCYGVEQTSEASL